MLALLRLLAICFVALTVVYVTLSLWSRGVRRRRLERDWDEARGPGDRDTFVAEGLRTYDHSLRRKLILGVYLLPLCLIGLIVYLTNFH